MTDYQAFVEMLKRAGIGHSLCHDRNPPGESVQVEHEDSKHGRMVTDWQFDADGRLVNVVMYEGETC